MRTKAIVLFAIIANCAFIKAKSQTLCDNVIGVYNCKMIYHYSQMSGYQFESIYNNAILTITTTQGISFHFTVNDNLQFIINKDFLLKIDSSFKGTFNTPDNSLKSFGIFYKSDSIYLYYHSGGIGGGTNCYYYGKRTTPFLNNVTADSTDLFDVNPNPADQQILIISHKYTGSVLLRLYDVKGVKIIDKIIDVQKTEEAIIVDVGSVRIGEYLLSLSINNDLFRKKIIIK